ncbi:hypothetical protein ANCDUO_19543 [Ancylostoma duodenale]|uniref:Uncharacterized protein n=1 Tax=Ancylostoma duodenale TaxID=51022 RepID=A0A0C2FUQ1_9BILA|nr:hypothetical protein ANCDUO_19543 [Ancylostoma duodenale]
MKGFVDVLDEVAASPLILGRKSALTETKGPIKDEARTEELEQLKQATELKKMKQDFEEGKVASTAAEELQQAKAAIAEERQKLTEIGKEKDEKHVLSIRSRRPGIACVSGI